MSPPPAHFLIRPLFAVFLLPLPAEGAASASAFLSADTAYLSEGRDNLGGDPFLVSGVYSLEADGWFLDAGLAAEWAGHPRVVLAPWVSAGINEGYVSDGHDGLNHVEAGLAVRSPLTDRLELELRLVRMFPVDRDPGRHPDDESLGHHFEGGLTLAYRF